MGGSAADDHSTLMDTPNPQTPTLGTLDALGLAAAQLSDALAIVQSNAAFERALGEGLAGALLPAILHIEGPALPTPLLAPESRYAHSLPGHGGRLFQLHITPQPDGPVAVLSELTAAEAWRLGREHRTEMGLIGRFAGQLAHDLNNLLVVISGRGQLLQMALPRDPRLQEDIREILLAGQRTQRLATRLMQLRPTARQEPTLHRLDDEINNTYKLVNRLLPHKDKSGLKLDLQADKGRTRIDPAGLERALVCLIAGIQRHLTSTDSVTISTEAHSTPKGAELHLKITTEHPIGQPLDPYLEIALEMIGHPIAGARAVNDQQIELRFTREDPTPIAPYSHDVAEIVGGRPLRILLVDDNALALDAVWRQLDHLGHTVTRVNHPYKALDHFKAPDAHFDLVITDVIMPDMDGVELARHIQQITPKQPLLFISGFSTNNWQQYGVESLKAAQINLLHKPFALSTLAQKVREAASAPSPSLQG